jgi:hypothetical protein
MTRCRVAAPSVAAAAAGLSISLGATSSQATLTGETAPEIGRVLSAYASAHDRAVERWIHAVPLRLHDPRAFEAGHGERSSASSSGGVCRRGLRCRSGSGVSSAL